ncbi:GNAT family N-acetyltransferase [Streptomyces sp. NPDC046876]|uniref:GNAT family N-acetyltransferase n=1 Tax=Streptomyces sp. NPDC046876 TaxID=3155616 RepID=UPI0033C82620
MEPTALATARLTLRPHRPEDVDEVLAACQDPEIQRWIPVPLPYGRTEAEAYVLGTVPGGWREGTEFNFAARLTEHPDGADGPGPLVASVAVVPRGPHAHEIGYWAAPGHRGRGLTTEAVLAAARWAFTEAGCVRLVWRAGVGNAGSRAVAQKAGFRIEGVQRAGMEHRGTLRDCWVGALLPSDLGLPSRLPYLPAPDRGPVVSAGA